MDSSRTQQTGRQAWQTAGCIFLLTLTVLLVHGFHPAAEDGGIYTAGIYLRLDPTLFPHDAAFVRAPMAYSNFAWMMSGVCRCLHLEPLVVVFAAHLLSIFLALVAADRICKRCGFSFAERLSGIALLAAWWTLPVAGTSLNIGDAYVTARSFSTPLSLFAISFSMEPWRDGGSLVRWRPFAFCMSCLALCFTVHELMFGFALVMVVLVRIFTSRRASLWMATFVAASVAICFVIQRYASAESPAFLQAELTRGYWFLSGWQWYEWSGLVAPLAIFALALRQSARVPERVLLEACIAAGLISLAIALVFAREGANSHAVARLQPLRVFVMLYVMMTLVFGSLCVRGIAALTGRRFTSHVRMVTVSALATLWLSVAGVMFAVQRQNFASSPQVEWPWNGSENPNPWNGAFRWCREHTPKNVLFAIDAAYIHDSHDDAQTFRAIALRSVLPDQSKDGGEAAVDAELAGPWQRGFHAQSGLNEASDATRLARLRPVGVRWVILRSYAPTRLACAYDNGTVKVCELEADR